MVYYTYFYNPLISNTKVDILQLYFNKGATNPFPFKT